MRDFVKSSRTDWSSIFAKNCRFFLVTFLYGFQSGFCKISFPAPKPLLSVSTYGELPVSPLQKFLKGGRRASSAGKNFFQEVFLRVPSLYFVLLTPGSPP